MNFGYNTVNALTSNESNNTVGIGSQAFGGPGYRNNGLVSGLTDSLVGYRAGTPGLIWQEKLQQNVNRMIRGANLNWRPTSWLQTRANFGTDFTDRVDTRFAHERRRLADHGDIPRRIRAATVARTSPTSQPTSARRRTTIRRVPWLALKTTLGTQYNNYRLDQNEADGTTLPPGAHDGRPGSTPASNEGFTIQKTWGMFVEESRRDSRSAVPHRRGSLRPEQRVRHEVPARVLPEGEPLVADLGRGVLPARKLFSAISNLRLRLANGASGVQPGPNDALQTFNAESASIKATDAPTETYQRSAMTACGRSGPPSGKAGFDSRLFGQPRAIRRHVLLEAHAGRVDQRDHRAVARLRRNEPAREPRVGQERGLGGDARRPTARSPTSAWTSTSARRSTRTRWSASARRRRRST